MNDQQILAEQLYEAVSFVIRQNGKLGLLKAVGDANTRVAWTQVHPQTLAIFTLLADKLTTIQRQG